MIDIFWCEVENRILCSASHMMLVCFGDVVACVLEMWKYVRVLT